MVSLEEPRWSCANSYQRGKFATIISGHKQQSIIHAKKKYRQERGSFGENKDAVRATSKKSLLQSGTEVGQRLREGLGPPVYLLGRRKNPWAGGNVPALSGRVIPSAQSH